MMEPETLALNPQYPHPGVYGVQEHIVQDNSYYQLVYKYNKFDVPKKMYGDTMANIIRIWNRYAITGKTIGSIFAGEPGTGKTLSCMALCNIAIQHNIPVVMCTEIRFSTELVAKLSMLTDCVLFLDEFKKNVDWDIENKMLSMLSESKNTRKLIMITENDVTRISQYILNRPQRARYLLEFNKISRAVLDDYLNDYEVNPGFRDSLVACYKGASRFSFDNLQAIVSEHLNYPEDDFDSIISRLNVPSLRLPVRVVVDRVEINGEPGNVNSRNSPVLREFKADDYIAIHAEVSPKRKEGETGFIPSIGNFTIRFNDLAMGEFENTFTYTTKSGDNDIKIYLVAKPMK